MPSYKLFYFNARGGAEFIRLIFAQAGVEYEDVRLQGQQWIDMKPKTPFCTIPVLEVDGKQLGGSVVIGRYLAEQFALAGDNALENAQIAAIVYSAYDLKQEVLPVWLEKDPTKKSELMKRLLEEVVPSKLIYFEQRCNTNDSGWLTGKLTWADLFLYSLALDWLVKMTNGKILDQFPGLGRLHRSVESLPNIAKWIKERPVTEF